MMMRRETLIELAALGAVDAVSHFLVRLEARYRFLDSVVGWKF